MKCFSHRLDDCTVLALNMDFSHINSSASSVMSASTAPWTELVSYCSSTMMSAMDLAGSEDDSCSSLLLWMTLDVALD